MSNIRTATGINESFGARFHIIMFVTGAAAVDENRKARGNLGSGPLGAIPRTPYSDPRPTYFLLVIIIIQSLIYSPL